MNAAPQWMRMTRWGALSARQLAWVDSIGLLAMASARVYRKIVCAGQAGFFGLRMILGSMLAAVLSSCARRLPWTINPFDRAIGWLSDFTGDLPSRRARACPRRFQRAEGDSFSL